MLHLAALHAVARPLAVAAIAIAGVVGPGLVAAHAAPAAPAASAHVASCPMPARGASMACAPSVHAMAGAARGLGMGPRADH
ncbi:MAG: hypothetical protein ACYDAN_11520 [Candidatus Limnocylindrales bacterium]